MKKRSVIAAMALALAATAYWQVQPAATDSVTEAEQASAGQEAEQNSTQATSQTSQQASDKNEEQGRGDGQSAQGADQAPPQAAGAAAERANLGSMADTLFQYTRPETRLTDLVASLERGRQSPVVAKESNPDTGEMAIVRTKSPLPGTRYFHAQYFTDENNESFVQHMSFEFKPGPTAMADATAAIRKSFDLRGEPVAQRDGYVKWKLDDQYNLWIKRMEPEDLKDDPFNAYTSGDVGTIRVAVELEVHGQDEDDDEHQHN